MAKDPVTGVANVISHVFKWMTPAARRERVEDGLISTLDGMATWLEKSRIKTGSYSRDSKSQDMLDHYMRQYDANRRKLK